MRTPVVIITFAILSSAALIAQTAVFPGAISSSQNLKVSVNGVATLLTQNIGSTDSLFQVSSCAGIVPYVLITIDTEIMNVTGCSGTTVVVAGRGFDSTVPAVHQSGAVIYAYVDAWHHNGLAVEIEAIEAALGVNLANVLQVGQAGTFSRVVATTGGVQSTNASGPAFSAVQSGSGAGYSASLAGGGDIMDGTTTAGRMMSLTDSAGNCSLSSGNGLVCTGTQPVLITSTPTFAGLTLNGGLTGTSGTFAGALSVGGTLSAASANFSGNLTLGGAFNVNSLFVTTSAIAKLFNANVTGCGTNIFTASDGSSSITCTGFFLGQGLIMAGPGQFNALSGIVMQSTLTGTSGTAIYGSATGGTGATVGVTGQVQAGTGIQGLATTGIGGLFTATSGTPVSAIATGSGVAASFQTAGATVATFAGSGGSCSIIPTATALSCTSDARLKRKSGIPIKGLGTISSLAPFIGSWISDPSADQHAWLSAQDVKAVAPELVTTDKSGYLSLNYMGLIPYLVKAIQEQQAEIEVLKKAVAAKLKHD